MEINTTQEKNIRVLIVEDNPGDIFIIKNYLKESLLNFTVNSSYTLKDALDKILNNSFDVILLDLNLPDSTGLNTLKKVINSGITVPIIILTNLNDQEIAVQALKDGAQDYLVKNDITFEALIRSIRYSIERSQAKQALQLLNKELDLKVQERTAEITEVNNLLKLELAEHRITMEKLRESAIHLKELNALKDKFFGIIAHDLRNPFAGILGLSELMLLSVDNMTLTEIKEIIQSFYNSAKSSFALVENLLEWSCSQTGSIHFNPGFFNINELIKHNMDSISAYAENKHIELIPGIIDDTEVCADRDMINTVLRNLLNNAVKFTHVDGKIMVSAIKNQDSIIISVKDNGVGISVTDMSRLFHIGSNYSNYGTAQEKGTGLGLLLCKEFIDKHGGKIWADSKEGEGSEFKFSIPLIQYNKKTTLNNTE